MTTNNVTIHSMLTFVSERIIKCSYNNSFISRSIHSSCYVLNSCKNTLFLFICSTIMFHVSMCCLCWINFDVYDYLFIYFNAAVCSWTNISLTLCANISNIGMAVYHNVLFICCRVFFSLCYFLPLTTLQIFPPHTPYTNALQNGRMTTCLTTLCFILYVFSHHQLNMISFHFFKVFCFSLNFTRSLNF